jgi:hypothetical protein
MILNATDITETVAPCYVGPCHHGKAGRRVAHGGSDLQIWRVATNVIVNKQLRTTDNGWSTGPRNCTGSLERPTQRKMDMRFRAWEDNIRMDLREIEV